MGKLSRFSTLPEKSGRVFLFLFGVFKNQIYLCRVLLKYFKMHPAGRWKFCRRVLKNKPMSNVSTAKILSRSQLWAAMFGEQPRPVTAFAFWWGMKPDNLNKGVIVYAENESHARSLAEMKLQGIVGHSGFVLGDRIEIV